MVQKDDHGEKESLSLMEKREDKYHFSSKTSKTVANEVFLSYHPIQVRHHLIWYHVMESHPKASCDAYER